MIECVVPDLAQYLAVVTLVVVAPGPDFALIVRSCVQHGREAGLRAALGVVSGLVAQGLAVAAGLATLVAGSVLAFTVLKTAGAAYLAYLGVQALRAALATTEPASGLPEDVVRRRVFWQGFLSNVTNPKVLVFYLALLPQFVDPSGSAARQVVLLALVHAAVGLAWAVLVVALVDRMSRWLATPWVNRVLLVATGVALIGFGAALLVVDRVV
ncbi:LysE family translocator [Umezawaea sp. NPDC059074]|uniref:LysE family translocator n=1 Tax=Umezawaea sp. NPDC059074 TaxID=3346716 RepID=UPI00368CA974